MNNNIKTNTFFILGFLLLWLAAACVPVPADEPMAAAEIMATAVTPTSEVTAVTQTTTPPASLNATAVPTPAPSPTPPFNGAALYPLDTRTGNETIDHVIEVVLNGSDEELRSLIFGFTTVGCTHELGLGGPPKCREGESEGTPVEVLFQPGIEGSYSRKEDFQAHFGLESVGLVAVYHVSEDASGNSSYDIIFLSSANGSLVLKVDQRGVVDLCYFDEGDYYDDLIAARLDLVNWTYLGGSEFAPDPDYIAENSLAARLASGGAEIILPLLENK